MARLQAYTAGQLRSSVTGVAGVDRSGIIVSGAVKEAANRGVNTVINAIQKREAAQDSLAVNSLNESRDLAKLEMQQFMVDNPDPDSWTGGWDSIVEKQQNVFMSQDFTAQTSRQEGVNQKAFIVEGKAIVNIAATQQLIENSIESSGKNLIKVFSNPLSSETDKANQKQLYQDALERKFPKEVSDVRMQETLLAADEQAIENMNKVARNLAAVNPEGTIAAATDELEARGKGETLFPEFSKLSNSDIEALKDYAGTVGEEKKSKSKQLMNKKIVDGYGLVRTSPIGQPFDLDTYSDTIELDPDMSDEDKISAIEKVKTYYSSYNSAVKTRTDTSDTTRMAMNAILRKVKRGGVKEDGTRYDMNAGFDDYVELKKQKGITVDDVSNKKFFEDLDTSEGAAHSVLERRNASSLDDREKLLRDKIEKQPNLLNVTEADEVLKDFANKAVLEFSDKYRDVTVANFDLKEVDAELDRLTRKYTLSTLQQGAAVAALNIRQAETLKEQQDEIRKITTELREAGQSDRADEVMDEAISLGMFIEGADDKIIPVGGTGGKKKTKTGILEIILQGFRN